MIDYLFFMKIWIKYLVYLKNAVYNNYDVFVICVFQKKERWCRHL